MKKIIFRLLAYIIDIIILGCILTTVVTYVPLFNNKKLDSINKEYSNVAKEYIDINNKYKDYFEDKIIDENEYNELKTSYPSLSESINDLVGKETTEEEVTGKFYDYAKELLSKNDYKINKLSLNRYTFEFVLTVLYLGVLQYVLKGQTIGKKVCRLYVVDESDNVPSLNSFLIRSLLTSTIVITLVNSILAISLKYDAYQAIIKYTGALSSFYIVIIFASVLFNDSERGLHDLLLKTHIKMLNKDNTEYKTLEYEEKENEENTNKTHRNVSKRSSK